MKALLDANVIVSADIMVIGDREVQNVKPMRSLRIVSPRASWEELKGRRGDAPVGR